MKKSDLQRGIALAVMSSGVLLGLWISSASGPKAQAQDGGAAQTETFPPPTADLPPPTEQLPLAPSSGGLQMQMPEEFTFATVNPEGFIYNPEGLRDPFFPIKKGKVDTSVEQPELKQSNEVDFNPQDPLQAFELSEYKLIGVMWDVREPRAMVLTPDGRIFTIKRKIRLGREGAVIAAIRESEIVLVEPNPDGTYVNASTRVITMKR